MKNNDKKDLDTYVNDLGFYSSINHNLVHLQVSENIQLTPHQRENALAGFSLHRENRANGKKIFQTGKTQGI